MMNFRNKDNSSGPDYKCNCCGVSDVKLWRIYQTFLEHQKLFCSFCALKDQKMKGTIDNLGQFYGERLKYTDQIGNLVPAVPIPNGTTFWNYTSVPSIDVIWWQKLPLSEKNNENQRSISSK